MPTNVTSVKFDSINIGCSHHDLTHYLIKLCFEDWRSFYCYYPCLLKMDMTKRREGWGGGGGSDC